MRRSRGLLIGMAVALTASVAGITAATAPAFAQVGTVTVNSQTVIEGQALSNATVGTFTSTTPADTFTASIDWGDGTAPSAGTVTQPTPGNFTVTGSHTYTEDGSFIITLTVNDTTNPSTGAGTNTATVRESTLTSQSVSGLSSTEGQVFSSIVGLFTDPGAADPANAYEASIDWGDGTTTPGTVNGAAGSYSVSGTHTYADEGNFNIVTTFDEKNDPTFGIAATSPIAVAEADALTGHPLTFTAPQGAAFSGPVATFTDTYTGNVAGDFTANIDWGDGSSSAGTVTEGAPGTYTVSGTHTYLQLGPKTVIVTLTDDAPGTATATAVSTANVAPNCTTTIQHASVRGITVGAGSTTCLLNDIVRGSVTVPAGAGVVIIDSTVTGGLKATNPTAVTVCESWVRSFVKVSGASGFVLLGDPGDDGCGGNTFGGKVTLTSNTGGLELGHNQIGGSVSVTGTTGPGPTAEDVGTEIEANTISGALTCTGNTPVATNDGQPNTVGGTGTGECAPPF